MTLSYSTEKRVKVSQMIAALVSTLAIFVACLITTILDALALLAVGTSLAFLAGFVPLQGAGYGVTSIVRPVFIAERLGRENFGIVLGLLAIAFLGGMALSPTLAALIWWLVVTITSSGSRAVRRSSVCWHSPAHDSDANRAPHDAPLSNQVHQPLVTKQSWPLAFSQSQ